MSTLSVGAIVYLTLLTIVIGACVGSFINCAAWRMVHGESVLRGRSHCATCGHQLSGRDLVPVVSWLALRGRCRHCGQRISPRYLVVELVTAAVFLSVLWRFGLSLTALQMAVLCAVLICLTLTDLDEQRIPNVLIVIGIVNCLVFTLLIGISGGLSALALLISLAFALADGLIIAVPLLLIALFMDEVLKRPSLGGGDVKLFFMVGMYFTWQQDLLLVILSCAVGIVFAMVAQARALHAPAEDPTVEVSQAAAEDSAVEVSQAAAEDSAAEVSHAVAEVSQAAAEDPAAEARGPHPDRLDPDGDAVPADAFPFGPSIALGTWLTMLFGTTIIVWYLGLFL